MPARSTTYHLTTRPSWRARGPEAEVRAFAPSLGVGEDPVTGSLNAGLAQWLAGSRQAASYIAGQGAVLGRSGRVHINLRTTGSRSAATHSRSCAGASHSDAFA